jgi:CDGSH-type Zn-finger protein
MGANLIRSGMADQTPSVRIEPGGPYRVAGGVPLARSSHVVTELGEPIDWAPLEPLATANRYALCRCGRSSTKPFCDDSHTAAAWDSEETNDRRPRSEHATTYPGDGVVMTDDRSLCSQAGFCANRVTTVWRMIAETSDPAVRERLRGMIDRCPSGALERATEEGAEPVEAAFEPSVVVVKDGPLFVRGRVAVQAGDGFAYETRNRMTLCRCGQSGNKPFCDGSHKTVGFRDG